MTSTNAQIFDFRRVPGRGVCDWTTHTTDAIDAKFGPIKSHPPEIPAMGGVIKLINPLQSKIFYDFFYLM